MKIKFMGAAGTVTGSSYILTSGSGKSILIDLGMFQGTKEIEKMNNDPYEYDCAQLDGAVLTHAHLDHCGRLPIMLTKGYKGQIWMTEPTKDLTALSLLDSAKIAEQDGTAGLYDKTQAYQTIDRFRTTDYHNPVRVGDFKVTFRDAGHIVGSAILEVEDLQPNNEIKKIVFSGDLGNTPEDLVKETELIDSSDVVIMESTYGDRLHSQENPYDILQREVNIIEDTNATLLIPAFALERTQEILHMFMHLKKEGKIKEPTPVYLDSPMAEKATLIYLDYPQIFNSHIQQDLHEEGTPFGFPGLSLIDRKSASQGLHKDEGSKVIIAGSGMMTGGRIVGHAAHYLPNPANRLLIVGYQGEGTLGRELMEGKKTVTIDDQLVPVRASVNSTQALSSHADQQQLLDWLKNIKNVKKVILTHGEDGPREALSKRISTELGIADIAMPHLHDEISL